MNDLKELRFNENNIQLKDNLVKGSILPEKISELNRSITIQANAIIKGAVYATKIEIQNGDTEIQGAVFAKNEIYINSDAVGKITFRKSVGSANSIVSRALSCDLIFASDLNAKSISLNNAFVAGSIYGDEIILNNCIVIGGVFSTSKLELVNCIVGTFNSPAVTISQTNWLLLPSAFSIEKINVIPGSKLYNLSLADLGSLFKGIEQSTNSGKIELNVDLDEIKSTLSDETSQKTIRSYSAIGKVLAADLIETDKFQNHFLLTAASLGPQLLKTYDFGLDNSGNPIYLSVDNLKLFFENILNGKTIIQDLSGNFDIAEITNRFK